MHVAEDRSCSSDPSRTQITPADGVVTRASKRATSSTSCKGRVSRDCAPSSSELGGGGPAPNSGARVLNVQKRCTGQAELPARDAAPGGATVPGGEVATLREPTGRRAYLVVREEPDLAGPLRELAVSCELSAGGCGRRGVLDVTAGFDASRTDIPSVLATGTLPANEMESARSAAALKKRRKRGRKEAKQEHLPFSCAGDRAGMGAGCGVARKLRNGVMSPRLSYFCRILKH